MVKGRKPTAAAKKKARGNPGRRKVKKTVASGSVFELTFAQYCEAAAEWGKYRKMLNEEGGRIKAHPTKKGAFLYNPVGFVDKIEKRCRELRADIDSMLERQTVAALPLEPPEWVCEFINDEAQAMWRRLAPDIRSRSAPVDEGDEFSQFEVAPPLKLHKGGKRG